jgi:dihydrofolate reductase
MIISLIAALASNRVIGKDNALLWQLPEDLRYFRETTRGKPVIMGRKTWESLPESFRPLPGRHNIVVSRDPAYPTHGATLAASLADAVRQAAAKANADEAFVIGGAQLYREALPIADRLYLTEIEQDFDGDVFFPDVSPRDWQEISRQSGQASSGLRFAFVVYRRKKG